MREQKEVKGFEYFLLDTPIVMLIGNVSSHINRHELQKVDGPYHCKVASLFSCALPLGLLFSGPESRASGEKRAKFPV